MDTGSQSVLRERERESFYNFKDGLYEYIKISIQENSKIAEVVVY